jgi:GNAT superfamily N-acetyltransferase
MLEFHVEQLTPELIEEMKPLQDGYWQEVAGQFHDFPPDVDWKTYLLAQQTGKLKVLIARVAGKVKAGAFIVITPHPHYACIAASLPLLFVHPEYRRGREGLRLVRAAEDVAIENGAQLMMTHGGTHNNVYRLFEAMDYQDFGRYFVKVIGENKRPFYKGGN